MPRFMVLGGAVLSDHPALTARLAFLLLLVCLASCGEEADKNDHGSYVCKGPDKEWDPEPEKDWGEHLPYCRTDEDCQAFYDSDAWECNFSGVCARTKVDDDGDDDTDLDIEINPDLDPDAEPFEE